MKITGSTKGFPQAEKHIEKIVSQLRGEQESMYRDIGGITQRSISQNFASGGRPTWPERKYTYPWPILNKTGLMKNEAERSALDVWLHTRYQHLLNIYSTYYANYHQYGIGHPVRAFVQFIGSELLEIQARIRKVFE